MIIYHALKEKKPYQDLGEDFFDHLDTEQVQRSYVRHLEQLGYTLPLKTAQ